MVYRVEPQHLALPLVVILVKRRAAWTEPRQRRQAALGQVHGGPGVTVATGSRSENGVVGQRRRRPRAPEMGEGRPAMLTRLRLTCSDEARVKHSFN